MQQVKDDGVSTLTLRSPYLILLGDAQELVDAKTGAGLVQWCPEKVMGQLRFDDLLGPIRLALCQRLADAANRRQSHF